MRVVSVLPSATEIVFALGHGEELVGRSEECDSPSEVASRPVVMRPKTRDFERSSREIDVRVRAARERDESLYDLDLDALASLAPDLLLTQDLCRVCSVTDEEVRAACALAHVSPRVLSLSPRTLEEVWRSFEEVGGELGDPDAGARLAGVARTASRPSRAPGPLPRVAIVEWVDPPILAGLWTPDIVRAAGAEPIGPASGAPGVTTDWDRIAQERPDLVIVSPCSFSVARTRRELAGPTLRGAVEAVSPARGTYLADEAYFSRPGPRLAEGVTLVRRLLEGGSGPFPMPVEPFAPVGLEARA